MTANALTRARAAAGLSQLQLARRCNALKPVQSFCASYIGRIERRGWAYYWDAQTIDQALGCTAATSPFEPGLGCDCKATIRGVV